MVVFLSNSIVPTRTLGAWGTSRSYQSLTEHTSVAHLHLLSLVSALAIGCAWYYCTQGPDHHQTTIAVVFHVLSSSSRNGWYLSTFSSSLTLMFRSLGTAISIIVMYLVFLSTTTTAYWLLPACLSGCRSPREYYYYYWIVIIIIILWCHLFWRKNNIRHK